jgi:hypothetical protein
MNREIAKKAHGIDVEIDELNGYKEMLKAKHVNSVHFEICQHYGKCESWEIIKIETKHNDRLFALINKIIEELEAEISGL